MNTATDTATIFATTLVVGALAMGPAPVRAELPSGAPMLMPEALETYRDARRAGGPGKDGIPSIDRPRFRSAAEAGDFLDDGDRVIGYVHEGTARAYPQRILVWHEIVNDTVAGKAISITYCPLTGTALGFERNGTELGVSGKLLNSNLVMYDRDSGSEYPQILGAGIAGPRAGEGLEEVRVVWTTWAAWRARHPDTEVLSTETGHARNYRRDPYGGYNPTEGYYAPDSRPFFRVLHEDGRFAPKHEVFGFRDREQAVAVEPGVLAERGVIHHSGPGGDYVIIHDPGLDTAWVFRGERAADVEADEVEFGPEGPTFPGREGLESVNGFEAMWFAWFAFYPDTEIIDASEAA